MEYMCGESRWQFKKIITLQKRAIRTINQVWYRSHTEPLFKSNQILKFEDMYTMQVSLFVYDLNNDLLPKSFRNLLSQNCLARHGIITRQNNLIPQSRPRTTFSSKLPKHNFTRIWNKTGSTLAHGKNKLTFKRLLKNRYLEAYETHIKCTKPRCTDCCDKWPSLGVWNVPPWSNKRYRFELITAHSYKPQYELMAHRILTTAPHR